MISESATAETTAPPRPCTARAATSSALRASRGRSERGEREERDPAEEEPPVAEEVAEPAAEQQEAAEGEQVGVHDPGERGLARSRGRPGSTAAPRSRSSCRGRSSGRPGRGDTARASGCGVSMCHGVLLPLRSGFRRVSRASRQNSSVRVPMSFRPPVLFRWLHARERSRSPSGGPIARGRSARAVRPRLRVCSARTRPAVASATCTASSRTRSRSTRSRGSSSPRAAPAAGSCCGNASDDLLELVEFMGLGDVSADDPRRAVDSRASRTKPRSRRTARRS